MWLLFKFWSPAHHTRHNSGAKGLTCVHFALYFHDITCAGCAGMASHYTQASAVAGAVLVGDLRHLFAVTVQHLFSISPLGIVYS